MYRFPRPLLLSLLLFGGVGLTPFLGCSFLKKTIGWVVSRPQVDVRYISIKKASLQGVQLEVGLLVHNPNDFALSLSKLKYNLQINETQIAEGAYQEKLTIPADDSLHVDLPISIDPRQSLSILKKVLQEPSKVMAKWHATAFFASPVGDLEISFEDQRKLTR